MIHLSEYRTPELYDPIQAFESQDGRQFKTAFFL